MSERYEVPVRRSDDGHNRPDVLQQILAEINEAFPGTLKGLTNVVKGKGQQQLAKARETQANILKIIVLLDLERQRSKDAHLERMYQLETQRLQAKAKALRCNCRH